MIDNNTPWYTQAIKAFFSHWWLKALGIPALIGVFFAAYFYLLKNPAYPITVMPLTALDRLISFQPLALPLYVSIWLYVSLPPALLTTRRELTTYTLAMAATCLAGLIVFYFWPTTVPVFDIDWIQSPGVNLLKDLDATGNACPSLHVATAAFSCVWLHHLLRRIGAPRAMHIFNVAWFIGIAYSTIGTRQHVAVDVLAGLALGMLAGYLSLRNRANTNISGA
jgi:membrane-associated phospholipid phosphatase